MKIDIEELQKLVEQNLPKILTEALLDKYDSPLKKAVEEAVKEKTGVINVMVNEILSEAFTNPKFKEKLSDMVLSNLINKAINR